MKILLYTPVLSSRLQYTTNIVFGRLLFLNCDITTDKAFFSAAKNPKINYSKQRICSAEIFIPATSLLFEKDIQSQNITTHYDKGLPILFQQNLSSADFSFDLLAMVFYLLSRYEEYLPFTPDQFGRFRASQSIAFKDNFLKQPLINQWAMQLKTKIEQKFEIVLPTGTFQFLPTYDIDMAWCYQHKGLIRTLGGFAKDIFSGDWKGFLERSQVMLKGTQDPFFTFNLLNEWHQQFQLSPIWFFLLGDYAQFDTNISHKVSAFRQLINQLHKQYQLGIHPSFQSNFSEKLITLEKRRLENIVQNKITKSRQHFLKLHLPDTYRRLIKAGITADYSMGYAENIGFRASIATPFPWYDLEKEKATNLMIHPFQVMDVTLKQYLNLSPDNALTEINALIQSVKSVNGTFCSLWHNSSFAKRYGWEGWGRVYLELLKIATT